MFDITSIAQSYAGQTIRVSFEVQATYHYFNVALDSVSLMIEGPPVAVNDAYTNYQIACEEWGEKPLSMSSFRKFIEALEGLGILGMVVSHIGRGKRGRRAKLTIHDVPALILIERIESILSQQDWQ